MGCNGRFCLICLGIAVVGFFYTFQLLSSAPRGGWKRKSSSGTKGDVRHDSDSTTIIGNTTTTTISLPNIINESEASASPDITNMVEDDGNHDADQDDDDNNSVRNDEHKDLSHLKLCGCQVVSTTDGCQNDMRRKIVFVICLTRSGSSLLTTLLANMDKAKGKRKRKVLDIANLGEAFHFHEVPRNDVVRDLSLKLGSVCDTDYFVYSNKDASDENNTTSEHPKSWLEELRYRATHHNAENLKEFLVHTRIRGDFDPTKAASRNNSKSSIIGWPSLLVDVTKERFHDPMRFLSFINNIPTTEEYLHNGQQRRNDNIASRSFYVDFKLGRPVGHTNRNLTTFLLDSIQSTLDNSTTQGQEALQQPTQVSHGIRAIVLWRRQFLERFVSREIAIHKEKFSKRKSDESDAINVSYGEIQDYAKAQFSFFQELHDILHGHGEKTGNKSQPIIPYHVVEYGKDLLDLTKQRRTVKGLMDFLEVPAHLQPIDGELDNMILGSGFDYRGKKQLTKQAQVPVSAQVVNFDEVQQWGFYLNENDTEIPDDWEEFFSRANLEKMKNKFPWLRD